MREPPAMSGVADAGCADSVLLAAGVGSVEADESGVGPVLADGAPPADAEGDAVVEVDGLPEAEAAPAEDVERVAVGVEPAGVAPPDAAPVPAVPLGADVGRGAALEGLGAVDWVGVGEALVGFGEAFVGFGVGAGAGGAVRGC